MKQGNLSDLRLDVVLECNPLVSIIIPVYNTPESLLRMAISSVLSQTYKNFELVIVDDGSDSQCREVLARFAAVDARVKLLEGDHRGVSRARNLGIAASKGEWLVFSDADDEVEPGFIEEGLTVALCENCDLVFGTVVHLYSGSKKDNSSATRAYWVEDTPLGLWASKMQMLGTQKHLKCDLPEFRGRGPIAKLFRKDILGDLRFNEDISIGEDTLFNYQFIEKCSSIGVVDSVWYWYYQYQCSSIHTPNPIPWILSIDGLMALRPTGEECVAFDSRCAFLVLEGIVNFLASSRVWQAYGASKALYSHAYENGWLSGRLFDGYSASLWLRVCARFCMKNKFNFLFALCVMKSLKNKLQSKKLIGGNE